MPKKKKVKKRKRKIINESNVNIEIFKSLAATVEMMHSFKDMISSLVDMAMKQNADMSVMNERWKQIKDKTVDIDDCLEDIQTRVNQIVNQWDYKERTAALEKRKIKWSKIFKIFKNPYITVIIVMMVIGLLLLTLGVITPEQFVKGLGKLWPF